jgi:hypothetical protein
LEAENPRVDRLAPCGAAVLSDKTKKITGTALTVDAGNTA